MRGDGRAWDELRPVRMRPGFVEYAEGSVLIEAGGTRVLCNATVEDSVPAWRHGSGAGWVTAEYAMLPRSTHQRTRRETRGLGGRTQEIRRLIGRSLRAAVDLGQLGEQTILLDCDVIQADGGTRTVAITGGYVALALAVQHLVEAGAEQPEVLTGQVAADTNLRLTGGHRVLKRGRRRGTVCSALIAPPHFLFAAGPPDRCEFLPVPGSRPPPAGGGGG